MNSTNIDSSYTNNPERIPELVSFLRRIQADSTLNIANIFFCGAASPEGSYEWNRPLAYGRMQSLERLVRSNVDIPDSKIIYNDNYIAWNHLAALVEASDMSRKGEILEIINEEEKIVGYINGRSIDRRVLRLKALDGGKVWRELSRRYFTLMRNACVVVVTFKKINIPETTPPARVMSIPLDTIRVIEQPLVAVQWHRKLSVKTNALAWAAAISNIGIEADICKHVSFNLPVYYSAWDYFRPTVKFRTLALQPEVRYWLSAGNDGWFAGAHFGLAYYNVATNGKYRTQDHNGTSPALGGGAAVGYRMPIGRNRRWRMEFSVGAGAYKLHHDKFRNYHNGLLVSTERKTYIGIDQASVSFSYAFGLKRKGGAK